MSAGYSRKSLSQKLGIKQRSVIALLNAPGGYDGLLGELPDEVIVTRGLKGRLDFIQFFVTDRVGLERGFPRLKASLKRGRIVWVSWPKASSRLRTDLSDGVVREVGLKNGLVDVKVCAVDDSWSALKFVRRLKDREENLHPKNRKV
ncbi:MAG TPA: hypothetical protein VND40_01445 [Nitrososphaerales archaeon]|nr:hypothetical protein [Nitrososphaerales archaeon]